MNNNILTSSFTASKFRMEYLLDLFIIQLYLFLQLIIQHGIASQP